MEAHTVWPISDSSHPGQVRREAMDLATRIGFDATHAGRAALVATEATTNIVKHAGRGQVLMRALEDSGRHGLELLALDTGPGMEDVARCVSDGYSTAGSPGTGLGALQRIASRLEIYSRPASGTALLAQVWPGEPPPERSAIEMGCVRVALHGQAVSGDDGAILAMHERAVVMLADGLGHGAPAAQAANEAVRQLTLHGDSSLLAIAEAMHGALRATRGAAVALAEVSFATAELRFAGLGNVAACIAWPGGSRRMLSQNGTLGAQLGQVRVTSYPWRPNATLIMYTDGLNSHTTVESYPGLLAHHPSLIAAVLYRDFARGSDDATVLVMRQRRAKP